MSLCSQPENAHLSLVWVFINSLKILSFLHRYNGKRWKIRKLSLRVVHSFRAITMFYFENHKTASSASKLNFSRVPGIRSRTIIMYKNGMPRATMDARMGYHPSTFLYIMILLHFCTKYNNFVQHLSFFQKVFIRF